MNVRSILLGSLLFLPLFAQGVPNTVNPPPAPAAQGPTFNDRFLDILQTGAADPWLAEWLADAIITPIRHSLDKQVWQTLNTNPVGRATLMKLKPQLDEILLNLRRKHESMFGRAEPGTNGQFQHDLELAQEVARRQGFSHDAVKNQHLFVGIGEDNAYTYSPVLTSPDFLLYWDLQKLGMTDQDIQSVMGHEFTHIRARHILIGLTLQTIFSATGEILIPHEKLDVFRAMVQNEGRKLVTLGLHQGAVDEKLVDHLIALSQSASDSLKQRFATTDRKSLKDLVSSLTNALGVTTTESLSADDDDPFTKIKTFKSALVRLQRSEEITADRGSIVTIGFEPLFAMMSKLASGPNANPAAILKQANELIKKVGATGADTAWLDDGSDHPPTILRAAQHLSFMSTQAYKTASDPILQAFAVYLKASHQLSDEKAQLNASTGELSILERVNLSRQDFVKFARSVSDLLVFQIQAEMNDTTKTAAQRVESIGKIFDYMDLVNAEAMNTSALLSPDSNVSALTTEAMNENNLIKNPDLAKPGRFFYELREMLKKSASPVAKILLTQLDQRVTPYTKASQNLAEECAKIINPAKPDGQTGH